MKNRFRGHFGPNEEERKEIWRDGTFVFDANVLLNLYRYSEDTRKQFLGLLKKESERCWLPEQCGAEYLSNRLSVISEQIKKYTDVSKKLEGLQSDFDMQKGHPFLKKKSLDGLKATVASLKVELDSGQSDVTAWINNDPIKEEIAEIFDERVGDPFEDDELVKLFEDGQSRYERKIPPGYEDRKKGGNGTDVDENKRKFGDLIFWKQILKKAADDKHHVILVTDDRKEDWWQEAHGRTVGPRPELIGEFCSETDQQILIYTPLRFLELAEENLDEKISATAIEEVKSEEVARSETQSNVSIDDDENVLLQKWGQLLGNYIGSLDDQQAEETESQAFSLKYLRKLAQQKSLGNEEHWRQSLELTRFESRINVLDKDVLELKSVPDATSISLAYVEANSLRAELVKFEVDLKKNGQRQWLDKVQTFRARIDHLIVEIVDLMRTT